MKKRLLLMGFLLLGISVFGYLIFQRYITKALPPTPISPQAETSTSTVQDDSQVIDKIDTMEETVACDKNKSPSPSPSPVSP